MVQRVASAFRRPFSCQTCLPPPTSLSSRRLFAQLFQRRNAVSTCKHDKRYLPTAVRWRGLTLRPAQSECSLTTGKLCDSRRRLSTASVCCETCVCSAVPTSGFAPASEHHNQNDDVYDCTAATDVYFCLSVCLSTFVFDTLFIKITANSHVFVFLLSQPTELWVN